MTKRTNKVYIPLTKEIDGRKFYSVMDFRPDVYLNRKSRTRTFSKDEAESIAKGLRPKANARVFKMEDGRYMVYVRTKGR